MKKCMNAWSCWGCGKTGHIAANCIKESWNRSLNAADEDKGDISEEVHEDEDELHACWRRARTSNGKRSPAKNQN